MLKHIAVGLLIPYCIFLFLYLKKGFDARSKMLEAFPFIFLACAIWSIIPNIMNKLPLGIIGKIANNFFISNIFFFHGILRKIPRSGAVAGLGLIFIMFFSLMFIYAKHLGEQEKDFYRLKKLIDSKR
jgi:hypothetical protein